AAAVAALHHVLQQPVAELRRVARHAEHGDGARLEERGEAHRATLRSITRTALPSLRSIEPNGTRRISGESARRSWISRFTRSATPASAAPSVSATIVIRSPPPSE